MDDKKIIIILLVVIIAILGAGIVMMSTSMSKQDCQLAVSDDEVHAGDSMIVSLTDLNGDGISNGTIHVKLTSDDVTIEKDIKTNSKGNAKIKIAEAGKYQIECSFDGKDAFKSASLSGEKDVKKAVATSNSNSPHTISVVPEFDKNVKKTVGEYTVEATKWRGTSVGGFGVFLYKNGQLMDRNSYQSRAYFYMDGQWKWSNWDNGEEDAVYHKYPVSNDVEIREIEVSF